MNSQEKNEVVLCSREKKGVAILRVNRPEARNALNWAAQERFGEIVSAVSQDPSIRVLIITGTGNKAFVSGGDLKELNHYAEREAGQRLNRIMSEALNGLTKLPIPVIAAINGDSFGGGCEIITACDLRIAAEKARFGFMQVRNGLTTGWGGTGRLLHLCGRGLAQDLLLTARVFTAEEALHMNLIQRIVPENRDALEAAIQWAQELVDLPREALSAIKALIYEDSNLTSAAINALEASLFVDLWTSADHLEALAAFNEKREPAFNRA